AVDDRTRLRRFHFFFTTGNISTPRELIENPCFRVPCRPRPLRSTKNLSIHEKLQNRHIAQPIRPQPFRHQPRRSMNPVRPSLPVKPPNPFQIPLPRPPTPLIRHRRHFLLRQERRLLRSCLSAAKYPQRNSECHHLNHSLHIPLRQTNSAESKF